MKNRHSSQRHFARLSRPEYLPERPASLQSELLESRVMLSTVQVIAAGSTGTEEIQLEIDGAVVQVWNDIGDQAFNGGTVTRSHSV